MECRPLRRSTFRVIFVQVQIAEWNLIERGSLQLTKVVHFIKWIFIGHLLDTWYFAGRYFVIVVLLDEFCPGTIVLLMQLLYATKSVCCFRRPISRKVWQRWRIAARTRCIQDICLHSSSFVCMLQSLFGRTEQHCAPSKLNIQFQQVVLFVANSNERPEHVRWMMNGLFKFDKSDASHESQFQC